MNNTTPYPGHQAHVEGMSEDANEARIAHNELAWVNHQIDNQIKTVDSLRDQLVAAEKVLDSLVEDHAWLTRNDEEEGS